MAVVLVGAAWKTKNILGLPFSISSSFDWKKGRHLLEKSRFRNGSPPHILLCRYSGKIHDYTYIPHICCVNGDAFFHSTFRLHSYMFKYQNPITQYTDCWVFITLHVWKWSVRACVCLRMLCNSLQSNNIQLTRVGTIGVCVCVVCAGKHNITLAFIRAAKNTFKLDYCDMRAKLNELGPIRVLAKIHYSVKCIAVFQVK